MKIFIGSDHAGFALKGEIIPILQGLGYEVIDKGPFQYNEGDDYPDYVIPVAREIAGKSSKEVRGVIIAGSGQGEIIAANRFPGVRAAVFYGSNLEIVKASRDHNDSNMICLGARFATDNDIKAAVKLWLATPFSEAERHKRRLSKIEAISK
jgi:ribose 5-phosphate isomerase B